MEVGNLRVIGPIIEQANSKPSIYPISKMRFAFTYDKKIICAAHTSSSYGGSRSTTQLWGESGYVTCVECGKTFCTLYPRRRSRVSKL